jgi:hypothetical protein
MSDTYVYRNKNTEQVIQHDGPHMRLERLGNWERLVGDDPAEAADENKTDVPLDLSGLGEAQVAVDGPDVNQVDNSDKAPAEPVSSEEEGQAPAAEPEAAKPIAKKATRKAPKASAEKAADAEADGE